MTYFEVYIYLMLLPSMFIIFIVINYNKNTFYLAHPIFLHLLLTPNLLFSGFQILPPTPRQATNKNNEKKNPASQPIVQTVGSATPQRSSHYLYEYSRMGLKGGKKKISKVRRGS
ncbi:hypothetical protein L873DRAFT_573368 [Choiromyces venosus 120613-1]|uniref:Uncharacterized protein n=1 Tax=Choiromyces venosus 120613-1 TaxID=1336337 RepID=A0A3N4JUZ7_9PEZI|nr:hypothetical protein L873DRAFT_573368 [Choiromyces venosus 120613-1]